MLTINKKSWHYLLYKASYNVIGFRVPQDTNLCQYFRRLMFAPFIFVAGMIALPLFLGLMCINTLAITILRLPLGYYPTSFIDMNSYEQYNGLKIGKSFELYPWHVMFVFGFGYLNHWLYHHSYKSYAFWLVALTFIPIAIIIGAYIISNAGFAKLLKENWKAKKEKICPLVKFERGE